MVEIYKTYYLDVIKNYADIYKIFYSKSKSLLNSNGIVCLITPNTYLTQPRYKDLRLFLLNTNIIKIVNLGDKVFDAVVPTSITFIKKNKVFSNFKYIDCTIESSYNGLDNSKNVDVYRDDIISIDDISFAPNKFITNGTKTLDEVFILKDAGIQYHRSNIGLKNKGGNDLYERLFSNDKSAFKNVIPTWYGKLIAKYYIQEKTDEYFNLEYKKILKDNESVSFSRESFDEPIKIIWRQTADSFIATIDTKKRWFRNTIQCGYLRETYVKKIDYYFALGIFNSSYLKFIYNEIVRESGRTFPQVKLTHLKKLPFPVCVSVETQTKIKNLVLKIIEAKKTNPETDTNILENEINEIVFDLYELTENQKNQIRNK